jgi:hypothetical protein
MGPFHSRYWPLDRHQLRLKHFRRLNCIRRGKWLPIRDVKFQQLSLNQHIRAAVGSFTSYH